MNSSLLDGYCWETGIDRCICDRVAMTAELTDSPAGVQLDAVPCMTNGRYHVPHTHADEPPPKPQADVLKLVTTSPGQRNADVLQARLFIELLEDELAELNSHLAATERRAAKQGADKHRDVLRKRIAGIMAMLDAIGDRFPTA